MNDSMPTVEEYAFGLQRIKFVRTREVSFEEWATAKHVHIPQVSGTGLVVLGLRAVFQSSTRAQCGKINGEIDRIIERDKLHALYAQEVPETVEICFESLENRESDRAFARAQYHRFLNLLEADAQFLAECEQHAPAGTLTQQKLF